MKKILFFLLFIALSMSTSFAETADDTATDTETTSETATEEQPVASYLKAVINVDEATEIQKSTIFDASRSFIPDPEKKITYKWNFGDGNKNEGIEVLHSYKEPGRYTVTLNIESGEEVSETKTEIFAYKKLIVLITDIEAEKDQIEIINKNYAENRGVYLKIIESFGASTEFISEEVLAKKLTEQSATLQKANQIAVWTKENAGLNALARYIQNNAKKNVINFSQKSINVVTNNVSGNISRIQRQFSFINPKTIIVFTEGAFSELINSENDEDFIKILSEKGHEYEIVTSKTSALRPWNFMSYFVDYLVNQGIPDNIIALLLLLPVIATIVAFMKQVVGMTTFGIYTPSIITLSFLIIGIKVGLIILILAILIGSITRPALSRVRMLFIPKMAIVLTVVSLILFLILIISNYLGLFDATFLSIAIFPMLVLSTLVEKFVSVKSEKGLSEAIILMTETIVVAIIAYFLVGGEISGFQFDFIKRTMLNYPEIIFLLLVVDIFLGRWTGLRILERIRFREVLKHIEEE